MNTDKIYAEQLANEYAPKDTSKVIALRKLDARAKLPATVFTYSFGIISALVLGVGMCLAMGQIGSGTTGIFDTWEPVAAKLEEAIAQGKAHESDPAYAAELLGWMFARCDEGATLGNEWICHDPFVQKDHAEDPFDAFTHPTHNVSLLDFIRMMQCINGKEWAQKIPAELPILLIAGDQDPVGNYGEGVMRVANWLIDTGHEEVTSILYPGYRHEIHNYETLKFIVEEDTIDFLESAI